MAAGSLSPRARYREQTRAEIKEIALRQLAEGGTAAVALTRIAKEVGLSGPALYRYFDSRDALLTDLIRDAYADLGAAVAAAADALPVEGARRVRLRSLAVAVRSWAVAQPHRYLLIEGTPVPGYTAPSDTLASARAVLGPFLPCFEGAGPAASVRPVVDQMTRWAAEDAAVAEWAHGFVGTGEVGTAMAGGVLAWAQLHGAVGLEVSGQFRGMGHDGGTLLMAQMDSLADAFGLE
ncbi:TetR family transcriptional regulator [Streptomyces sp. MUSC 125]|uniref:TetR/AcrR family transcriptional regulator n=1 Tax=Streptomyces sp. MUSC 125 TaxID=1428624 RepID=UPI0005735F73|nr:TetR/AcrR family transcriptional regulator [Streptomyces sp. MUSC 125]KIE25411.1 TetR family transcriptional regulator [Streptomyces sp. MUSC 125]